MSMTEQTEMFALVRGSVENRRDHAAGTSSDGGREEPLLLLLLLLLFILLNAIGEDI